MHSMILPLSDDQYNVGGMTPLESRFSQLWTRCSTGSTNANTEDVWRDIHAYYGEDHRAYHTLEHINYCLKALDQAINEVDQPEAVELSIWFHDIIFQPGQANNEQKSAEFFQTVSEGILPDTLRLHVTQLILATMHHHHNISPPTSSDSQFMVDIDLSSFGLDEDAFGENTQALRQEQPELSDEEFQRSTARFFKSLLDRQRIFYTPYFFEQLEDKARQNIKNALQHLG